MIALLFCAVMAHAAPKPPPVDVRDFSASVRILKSGEPSKGGSIRWERHRCSSTNGGIETKRDQKVCDRLREQIKSDESTYSNLPWINNPDVASFIIEYRAGDKSWSRQVGVVPDATSEAREALRKLAVQVLETAK